MSHAVFLDRDGVLIQSPKDYVRRSSDIIPIASAQRAVAILKELGFMLVIASNQSLVGRGYLSQEKVEALHAEILTHFPEIDASYLCFDAPESATNRRKPGPGMLLQAAQELHIDLERSYFAGDSRTDIMAAISAGVYPVLVRTGKGAAELIKLTEEERLKTMVFDDLLGLAQHLAKEEL